MRLAVAAVCPDPRQRGLLEIVRPGWEEWTRRHALPLVVIERHPRPDAPYWGKYFPLELPELRGFDAVLTLDNDVVVNPAAPSPAEGWDSTRVKIADERSQFAHDDERFLSYYADYDLPPPGASPRVLNTGVMLYTREHAAWFATVHGAWRDWREKFRAAHGEAADAFRLGNDQPHVSAALQRDPTLWEPLDVRFNRLWWSWWEDGGRRRELPLKLYAKSMQLLGRALPRALVRPLAGAGRRWWHDALRENHFIHVAGSKSPISLYALGG